MNRPQEILKEEPIELKEFLTKLFDYWKLITITLILSLTCAFVYLRYSEPIYTTSATVLIRDKNNQKVGAENLLEGLELFSSKKNLENEIGVLGSYSMIYKTIKNLDFEVSYYSKGQVRLFELYKETPFLVVLDSLHPQAINTPFFIDILSDSTLRLQVHADQFQNYIPYNEQKLNSNKVKLAFDKVIHFNEKCETENFSFRIIKNQNINQNRHEDEKLYFVINTYDDLTKKYVGKLNINPINEKSSIVKLEVKGPVLKKEIDFVNQLIQVYIDNDLDEKNRIAINTIKFIDDQLIEVSRSLISVEGQLEKYRQSNNIMNLDISSVSTFEQLNALDNEKATLLVKDKYYRYLLKYVSENNNLNTIVAPSSIGINDPLLINLINDLNNLYSERAALDFAAESKNPSINILNQKIKNGKITLIENLKNIINSSIIALDDINRRIAKTNELIKKLPKTERDLVSIKRQFNLNDHIYNYLLEKRAEAGIAKAANTPDNKILDIAKDHGSLPVAPRRGLIYTIAFILGLLLPTLIIIIIEFFNDKVQSKEHLIKITSIPILGGIGHNKKTSSNPLIEQPKSAVSESFRSLRINLQYLKSNYNRKGKVIGITSSISGEGKTFCSQNLATVIALSGAKTIVIGADLRKPKINKEFNLTNEVGLSSYLIHKRTVSEIIQPSGIANLDVITSGPIPPNPTELLSSQRLEELLSDLNNKYDFIIIDTPPIALVSDYFILKKHIDSHLFIIRNRYTKTKALQGINELYENKEIENLFLVLNDLKPKYSGYGYGYGYSYGYGYYEEDNQGPLQSLIKKIRNLI